MGVYTGSGPTDPTVGSKASVTAFGVPTADVAQALVSATSSYTPTLGNVTTGTVTGNYTQLGKMVYLSLEITAGTVTSGASAVTLTMPGGLTAARTQGFTAMNAGLLRGARVTSGTITLTDSAGANIAGATSLANTRINGWVEIS